MQQETTEEAVYLPAVPAGRHPAAFAILLSVVAALGGFLFGFDSAVINGTVSALQKAFGSSSAGTGFSVSAMLLGSAVGAFYAGQVADRMGRKRTMLVTAILFALGALGAGFAPNPAMFIAFRVLGGIAVGAASVIAPAYIAEVAPAHLRGRLGSLQQLAIVVGIFLAFVSNYLIGNAAGSASAPFWLGAEAWRWMLAVQLLPSALYGLGSLWIPESPRYLVANDRDEEAARVLARIGEPNIRNKVSEIRNSLLSDHNPRLSDVLAKKTLLQPIVWIGLGLATLQQAVGINVVFYYGSVLWEAVGFTEDQSLLINVISGAVNITTTIAGMTLIDRLGRRPILMLGSIGMAVTLGSLALIFGTAPLGANGNPALSGGTAIAALLAANLYVVCFGFSWGPIVWVMLGEMFNNRIRGSAMSLCTGLHWVANFAVTMTFPILLKSAGLGVAYSIYATAALISWFFVALKVKETKGLELEAM